MSQPRTALFAMAVIAFIKGGSAFGPSYRNIQQHSFISRKATISTQPLSSSNTDDLTPLGNGSFVALITPFTASGAVDIFALRTLLQFHLDNGTDGLCILGTTGEATTLSMSERSQILSEALDMCKGKIPLLVGTGTINPTSVKEQTLQAKDMGCDAVLVVTPYYVKPPQRALVKHYMDSADYGMPLVMYNVPGRTGVDMTPENIALCAAHENIIGVKEATGDVSRVATLRKLCGDDFLLYSGDDGTAADFGLQGGNGCISVTANVAPQEMHDIMTLSDEQKIKAIDKRVELLHDKLFLEANPIPIKWAVNRMGLVGNAYCRPPLCELDVPFQGDVEEALRVAGLI